MSAAEPTRIQTLMRQKEELEEEIMRITEALTTPAPSGAPAPGLHGNLLTPDGFPRADIDVHAVRIARNRLAQLQTDHKAVMAQIEQFLFSESPLARGAPDADGPSAPRPAAAATAATATAAEVRRAAPSAAGDAALGADDNAAPRMTTPFARVREVAMGACAHACIAHACHQLTLCRA